MKKTTGEKLCFAAVLLLALTGICSPAAALAGNNPNLLQDVKKHIKQLITARKVPSIAVAVARNGEIIWEEGFGLADRECGKDLFIPMKERSLLPWRLENQAAYTQA